MSKVVVVTGAGAGVGRATAEKFASEGYDVALLSRDPRNDAHPKKSRQMCNPFA